MKKKTMSPTLRKKNAGRPGKILHLAGGRKGWLLLIGVGICAAVLAYPAARSFWATGKPSQAKLPRQRTERSSATFQQQLPQPSAVSPEPAGPPPGMAIPEPAATPQLSELAYSPPETVDALKKEELEAAEQLVGDFPNRPGPIGIMGRLHEDRGNTEAAIECWQRCAQLDSNSSDPYYHMGRLALRRAEYEKAVALWRKAIEINPARHDIYQRLAAALSSLGKLDEAIVALEKDIEITPRALQSHYLLGQAHLQQRDYQQAKEHYQAAIEINPNHLNSYYGLATVCTRLGQKEEAKNYRQKFKTLQQQGLKTLRDQSIAMDDLRPARRTAARMYAEIGRYYGMHGKTPKAEEFWRKAALLDPHNSTCRRYLAELYQSDRRDREALGVYQQLRRIEPENALICMNLSLLQARLSQFDAAERSLRKVIELAPQRSEGYDSLAQLYLHLGKNLPEAKVLAQKAVQLDPSALNYVTLSQASERTGDRANALSALQRAVELDPANESYKRVLQSLKEKE